MFYDFTVSNFYRIIYFLAVTGNWQAHGLLLQYVLAAHLSERGLSVGKVDLVIAVVIDFIVSS